MQFYDDLIREWGQLSGVAIVPGPRQTCRVHFPDSQVTLQIDLDRNGERILLGTNLGILNPGPLSKKSFFNSIKRQLSLRSPTWCFSL